MLRFITNARMDSQGQPKPIERSKGIKWAVASAVAILAATVFALTIASQIVMAGLTFASGAGIPLGLAYLASAAISIGTCVMLGFIIKECILNAVHHLNPPRDLNAHVVEVL